MIYRIALQNGVLGPSSERHTRSLFRKAYLVAPQNGVESGFDRCEANVGCEANVEPRERIVSEGGASVEDIALLD